MDSILTVTAPASGLSLLTLEELRAATGVASGADDELAALGDDVAAAIASRCHLRAAGTHPPTLLLETLEEEFDLDCPLDRLVLARRPIVAIVSVVEDGITLAATDYRAEAAAGLLQRRRAGYRASWTARQVVVAYDGGWGTVPHNLRRAAMELAATLWSEDNNSGDATLKRERKSIGGVIDWEKEWWVARADSIFTPQIEEWLTDYIRPRRI